MGIAGTICAAAVTAAHTAITAGCICAGKAGEAMRFFFVMPSILVLIKRRMSIVHDKRMK
jgi:hypothetical protein